MTNPKTSILFWVEMSKMPLDALQSDIGKSEAGTVQAMGLDVGALRNLLKEIKRYAEMLPDEPSAPQAPIAKVTVRESGAGPLRAR